MTTLLEAAMGVALGKRISHATSVSGGDIHVAYAVTLDGGDRVFVKTNDATCLEMFRAEAKGLKYLAEARALPTPEVLACGVVVGKSEGEGLSYLVLEWLDQGRKTARFDELLGCGLAALHQSRSPHFGWESDNYIGRLPQRNRPHETFASFFREERLLPQVELARAAGHFDPPMVARFDRLYARLDELLGPEEPPSRLHGDLWGGNCLVGPDGNPWLIDPAVYGGHREIDLAMMRLFGGFSPAVFDSYAERFPLSEGHEERVELMQLYPLLVHVNHFGQGYVAAVRRVLSRYT